MTPRQRRTQAERRAATTARLIEGTIAALSELGYARTSAKEICTRAGVSHGALFGRFATLLDLILAAGAEVARRQVHNFAQRIAQLPDTDDPAAILPLLRTSSRDPINAAWIELLVTARTDTHLRERLKPVWDDYATAILDSSRQVRALNRLSEKDRSALVAHVIHYFDGEALSAVLYPDPEFDQSRMTLLTTMITTHLHTPTSTSRALDE
ncbi:TetR/AcrR family transcriptional regulator [Amycolatopsis anabasis]|uniref:TetR/AcrR family transcriptional regulator n=1 Tax=Amycolatopsis anabasis TaxID=1840409 RepID=UPI00131AECC1|nr:TetR/AcrR family transcriptional regulator [Amycolatopsis anabasis]